MFYLCFNSFGGGLQLFDQPALCVTAGVIINVGSGFKVGRAFVRYDLYCEACRSYECAHAQALKQYLKRRGGLVYIYDVTSYYTARDVVEIGGRRYYVSTKEEEELPVWTKEGWTWIKMRGNPVSIQYVTKTHVH